MNLDSTDIIKGTILVVDDSPDNLRAMSMTLTKRGYRVRCATNGETALVSIDNCLPDLILLDIRMPIMNGYEVCQHLKANAATKHIPIIFLSAADDVEGKVKAFAIGGVDYITKPFQTEEVLARIANQLTIQQLQQQLTERNQRLQQEIKEHKQTMGALQDAVEAAEAANEVKSKFLATMSHELRTPLNAILGFAELMMSQSSLSAEHQDYLASISQSGQHLLKLLNHLLAVTSAEASNISLHQRDFDLHHLLKMMASILEQKATEKGLELLIECAPAVPQHIHADENKLRQVLMNLLENAIQFTQRGTVSLRVKVEGERTRQQDSERSNETLSPQSSIASSNLSIPLIFEIEDTGTGIAFHEINHLFQMFSQTETGQRSKRGLGLGLFGSRQFIQVMGGDITIASTPGQKTMVRFYILVHPVEFDLMQPSVQAGDRATAFPIQALAEPSLNDTEAWLLEAMRMAMPADWLAHLHQAAIKGFDHQISRLIQRLPPAHEPLARALTDWNQNFQFDRIVTITQQLLERTP
ncbi:hybrid sensor histidine kinase/response regulator [Stenomitos frigidus]|uniref:histidine kinase n=1 Tax=Stenomitos frigidus ULC18 TaxID=2107698 RepID=A0A2T1E367_9CYAN|nr:response regulator [Stenomitos frigidus]PSB27187.1 hybrid sensor histidine kinase/response regulator [Stenomitos frigidus ULC18]